MVRLGYRSLLMVAVAAASAVAADPGAALTDGVDAFRAGYRARDLSALERAAELFEAAGRETPEAHPPRYWLAVARFHLLLYRDEGDAPPDTDTFRRLVREARAALDEALAADATDAEAHAMLSIVTGMQIRRAPARAPWLGPSVMRHRGEALRHGAENPRVQYLVGAGHLRARDSRRGASAALPHLQRAEALYEAEGARGRGPLEPDWGRDHCLAFIAQAYRRLEEPGLAERYCRRALELNPDNGLARRTLDALGTEGGPHE